MLFDFQIDAILRGGTYYIHNRIHFICHNADNRFDSHDSGIENRNENHHDYSNVKRLCGNHGSNIRIAKTHHVNTGNIKRNYNNDDNGTTAAERLNGAANDDLKSIE